MIIGMNIGKAEHNTPILSIIQALSGGTFVYLACCDFLVHEFFEKDKHNKKETIKKPNERLIRFFKFLSMLLGAAIAIILVAIAPGHSHWT